MTKAFPKFSYDETLTEVRDVSDLISYISPTTVPLTALINGGSDDKPNLQKFTATSRKHEWGEKALRPATSLLTAALSDTSGTTIGVTAADGLHFALGTIFLVDSEQFIVTTKGTAAGVVIAARGAGGTTAATHANAATVRIVGRAHEEGTAAPLDSYTSPTQPFNYIQEFTRQFSASYIDQHIQRYGKYIQKLNDGRQDITDVIKMLDAEAMIENLIDIELQIIHGKKVEAASGTPARFGGILEFIATGNTTALAGASLSQKDVNDLMETIFGKVGNGGKMPSVAMCDGRSKRILTKLFGNTVVPQSVETARTAGLNVTRVETDFGSLDIVANVRYPSARIDFLCVDDISVGPLNGYGFRTEPLAKTGTFDSWQQTGSYTLEVNESVCHGSISGFDVNVPL